MYRCAIDLRLGLRCSGFEGRFLLRLKQRIRSLGSSFLENWNISLRLLAVGQWSREWERWIHCECGMLRRVENAKIKMQRRAQNGVATQPNQPDQTKLLGESKRMRFRCEERSI